METDDKQIHYTFLFVSYTVNKVGTEPLTKNDQLLLILNFIVQEHRDSKIKTAYSEMRRRCFSSDTQFCGIYYHRNSVDAKSLGKYIKDVLL